MNIKDSVILVTGANRGLGLALTKALLQSGARKVYAAARDPATITLAGVHAIRLDVTDAASIAAAVAACPDLTILINNAGVALPSSLLGADAARLARQHLDTNLFGPLELSQAFAPVLANNRGGAIVNILSVLSWVTMPGSAAYSISKAAAWAMSNALRTELRGQNTQVLSAHMGYMDTDMTRGLDTPKSDPAVIAERILRALESNQHEVLADEFTGQVKQGLTAPRSVYLGAE
ncbi:SDR family oxidoreductase [Duganella aceris]|uniref:SDR family oxidoreductase n=1 Tax=Duganella aceris TaxID=2703883 RepID=A0ABX0FKH4_9BURK|nr:SDR family oxidoreductase [Duganella aceris]NGZ85077.1 SDR family oxidoreductase [Duganella aceris]